MKIIIPLNGLGRRFSEAGYIEKKPLISISGKPMILRVLESLKVDCGDEILIIYNKNLETMNFEELICYHFKRCPVKFVPLLFETRGAAETVLCGLNNLKEKDLEQPIMLVDGDTIYKDDIVFEYKKTYGNKIFWFEDKNDKPIYSYVSINNDGKITQIEEKKKISDCANTGAYCFESGKVLKQYCSKALDECELSKNEFYISGIYKKMLSKNLEVTGHQVKQFYCVGTPEQLQIFASADIEDNEVKRFCFDLDNTLVSYPKKEGDYQSVTPIEHNIRYLRFLKSLGHTIIIYTARRMRTYSGNTGSVLANVGKITLDTLDKFDIPYDEIYFGKPYAHFYIDDCGINPRHSLEKQAGYYNFEIPTRSFNKLKYCENTVIKQGNIGGERYWYENIPSEIVHFFPTLLSSSISQIEISKIDGVPLSHLYVNNSLTTNTLRAALKCLNTIHEHESQIEPVDVDVYANYSKKLSERYTKYDYTRFKGAYRLYSKLQNFCKQYEEQQSAISGIIHGDPVFTNIILEKDNKIKFIDMRGKQGAAYTIMGDINYDLAKIYQSIAGYDFILHGKTLNEKYIKEMKKVFSDCFEEKRLSCIKKISATLFFTLIPLHDNDKCDMYYEMARKVFEEE